MFVALTDQKMAQSKDFKSCRTHLYDSSILIVKHILVLVTMGEKSIFQIFALNFSTPGMNKCLFLDRHIKLIHGIIADNGKLRYVLLGTMYSKPYSLLTFEILSKAWGIRKEPDHKVLSYHWIIALIVYQLYRKCKQYSGAVQFVQNWVRNSLYSPKKWVRKICSFLTQSSKSPCANAHFAH